MLAWAAVAVFAVTIIVVIGNVVDATVAALIGAVIMIWIGVMSDVDAFGLVDWNVMAILISGWIIASYFGKTGVPSWLSVQALRLSGGRPGLRMMILAMRAGVIPMFVDNLVVILMMARVALPLPLAVQLLELLGDRVKAPSFQRVLSEQDEYPADAILQQVSRRKCDLVGMASHGRRGLASVLLGSETQKVQTGAKVPVLVCR